jgi:hypothetical protein
MILQLNHLQGKAAAATQEVIETLYSLLAEEHIDQGARLRIQLDWLQYKKNFREVLLITEGREPGEEAAPFMHIQVDTRQVVPGCLKPEMQRAMFQSKLRSKRGFEAGRSTEAERLALEDFRPFRSSIALLAPPQGLGVRDGQGIRGGPAGPAVRCQPSGRCGRRRSRLLDPAARFGEQAEVAA